MSTTRRSDQGPSVFPDSENLVFGNSTFNNATNMYFLNTAPPFNHAPPPKLGHNPGAGIDAPKGAPNPRTLLDQRPLGAASRPKGLRGRVSGLFDGLTNRRLKVTAPTQCSSPYDSDSTSTPALTPGSSCASSPFSSQEDVRLSSMVEFEPPHLRSQNLTTPLVYYRNMLTANKGLPIFRPRPSNPNFGDRGTSLGDVGTYSVEGGFNKIFNIWDDEFELQLVADYLHTTFFCLPSRNKQVYDDDIPENGTIHRGASSRINLAGDGGKISSFDFHCQSDTGAVLVATSPADREELDNGSRIKLRDWILAYPEVIYRLANSMCPLGDEEPLYIVSGRIKSESWAIAAFLERGEPPHDLMRLQNRTYDGGRPSFLWTEKWSTTDATFGASKKAGLKNQTLFVTGYTLDFSPEFRGRMKRTPLPFTRASPVGGPPNRFGLSGDAGRPGGTDRFQQEGQEGGRPPVSEASRFNQFSRGGGASAGGSQDGGFDSGQRSAGQWSRHSGHHEVTVNFFPGPVSSPEFCHPSSLITKQLLAVTGKEVALCHDDEWRGALERLDTPDFAQAVIDNSKVTTNNGVASLDSTGNVADATEEQGPTFGTHDPSARISSARFDGAQRRQPHQQPARGSGGGPAPRAPKSPSYRQANRKSTRECSGRPAPPNYESRSSSSASWSGPIRHPPLEITKIIEVEYGHEANLRAATLSRAWLRQQRISLLFKGRPSQPAGPRNSSLGYDLCDEETFAQLVFGGFPPVLLSSSRPERRDCIAVNQPHADLESPAGRCVGLRHADTPYTSLGDYLSANTDVGGLSFIMQCVEILPSPYDEGVVSGGTAALFKSIREFFMCDSGIHGRKTATEEGGGPRLADFLGEWTPGDLDHLSTSRLIGRLRRVDQDITVLGSFRILNRILRNRLPSPVDGQGHEILRRTGLGGDSWIISCLEGLEATLETRLSPRIIDQVGRPRWTVLVNLYQVGGNPEAFARVLEALILPHTANQGRARQSWACLGDISIRTQRPLALIMATTGVEAIASVRRPGTSTEGDEGSTAFDSDWLVTLGETPIAGDVLTVLLDL